jgi:hypothetical protein
MDWRTYVLGDPLPSLPPSLWQNMVSLKNYKLKFFSSEDPINTDNG